MCGSDPFVFPAVNSSRLIQQLQGRTVSTTKHGVLVSEASEVDRGSFGNGKAMSIISH